MLKGGWLVKIQISRAKILPVFQKAPEIKIYRKKISENIHLKTTADRVSES